MNDDVYDGSIPGKRTEEEAQSGGQPERTILSGFLRRNDVPLSLTGTEMKAREESIGE